MTGQQDILGAYIQMREGDILREQADLAMIKQLTKERDEEHEARLRAESRVRELEQQISLIQSSRPITNNYNIGRDYIEKQVV